MSSFHDQLGAMTQKPKGHEGFRLRRPGRREVVMPRAALVLIWTITAPMGAASFRIPVNYGASDCVHCLNALRLRLSSQYAEVRGWGEVCNGGQFLLVGSRHVGTRYSLLCSRMRTNADEPESAQRKDESNGGSESVSQQLNRALESMFPKAYNFGSVGDSSRTFRGVTGPFAKKSREVFGVGQRPPVTEGEGEEDEEEEGDGDGDAESEDDEEEEDDESADMGDDGSEGSLEDGRSVWRKLSDRRSRKDTNRLLRAKTGASAGVVVDGPFSALEVYMMLPVSEYSVLDSGMIHRVSDSSFRLQVPLKHLVNLDLTPTMEVEVELDSYSKSVVFRSTRSTLYGTVSSSGHEAGTRSAGGESDWPAPAPGRVEYFRVDFDANLRWAKGDMSMELPRRGPGVKAFTGDIARRPRPTAQSSTAVPSSVPSAPLLEPSSAETGLKTRLGSRRPSATLPLEPGDTGAAAEEVTDDVASAAAKEAALRAGRGTVLCEVQVRVQVLLPPPYNTLLPWRLVRALLGKVLSTTVAYMLPRFLELLANDYYKWLSRASHVSNSTTSSKAPPRASKTPLKDPRSLLGSRKSWLTSGNSFASRRRRSKDLEHGSEGGQLGAGGAEESRNPARLGKDGVERLRNRVNGRRRGWRGRKDPEARASETDAQPGLEERTTLAAMDALYEWAAEGITGTSGGRAGVADGQQPEDESDRAEEDGDGPAENEAKPGRGARSWGPPWFQRRQRGVGAAGDGRGEDSSPRTINWWG